MRTRPEATRSRNRTDQTPNRNRSSRSAGTRNQPSRAQGSRSQSQRTTPLSLYRRLEDALPSSVPPIFVIALAAFAIFLIGFYLVIPTCSKLSDAIGAKDTNSQAASSASQADDTPTSNEEFDFDLSNPQQATLVKLLGDKTAAKLLNKAKTDLDVAWIAAHVDDYAFDGSESQYKILKLAADEDAAIPFVRSYPSTYPTAGVSDNESIALPSTSPSSDVPEGSIPRLYQWDMRWANTAFANNAMGLSGSGPTCLAMVAQGLTGNMSKNPYDIGKAAEAVEDEGGVNDRLGMKADYLYDGAADLGLNCAEMYPSYDTIRDALLTGEVIILDLEPGFFTSTDSYVVLSGIAGNGKAIMNDPYSMEHSSELWDIDELVAASKTMYVYSV